MNDFTRLVMWASLVAAGIAIVIFGAYDDSPGGSLIGMLLAAYALYRGVRTFGAWRSRDRERVRP